MKIVIIKYNAGNVQSVLFALERMGIEAVLTDDVQELRTADKIIFPGVGEASTTMNYLRSKNLDKVIVNLTQPVLGICLGMQLLCKHSEEGNTDCLGIFNQNVYKFITNGNNKIKIPQIGWNNINKLKTNLFKGVPENSFMYFVHSFYVERGTDTIATTNYITDYSSALQKSNFYAVQFHPEKSADIGQKILENFVKI